MKKTFIAIIVLSAILTAGETKKEKQVWRLYDFKGTEHFKYSLTVKNEDGKTEKGEYVIDLSKEGKKYRIKLNGSFAGNEGSVSTIVDEANSISGILFAQMIFNPWLAPLTTTLFSNAFVAVLTGGAFAGGLEESSHWSYKSEDGEKVEFKVSGKCKYAKRTGKLITMKTNDKTVYETCIDPEVALPLYIKFVEDNTYSAMELLEYKE